MMTDENRFFKFVWRFNGIVLMIVGVAAICAMIVSVYALRDEIGRGGNRRNTATINERVSSKDHWSLGTLTKIDGTDFSMIPLLSDQDHAKSSSGEFSGSSSGPGNCVNNMLFINIVNNNSKWLFNTNKYIILNSELISEYESCQNNRIVRAVLYVVVRKDTNGDKKISYDDKMDIAVSTCGGDDYKEIVTGIDNFIGHQAIDKDKLFIAYKKQGAGHSAIVSLGDFSLINQKSFPALGKSS